MNQRRATSLGTIAGTVRALRRRGVRGTAQLARAASLVALVEIGLHTLQLPRLCAVLGIRPDFGDAGSRPAHPRTAGGVVRTTEAERVLLLDALALLARAPWPNTCLRRSLVAGSVLRHHDPLLRIGVTKVNGRVRAHSWLLADGVNLDPSGSADFRTLGRP